MDIPVIPVRIDGTNMLSSHITFSGTSVSMTDNTVCYGDLVSSLSKVCGKETPMLIVDAKGMQTDDIIPEVLRSVRIKHDHWMMTGIRDAGDVMDAFQGNMSKVVVPYHLTSDTLLREMVEISDSCIPALFTDRKGVHMKGAGKGIRSVIKVLEGMGIGKVLVFDVSGDDGWGSMKDLADIIIPYASDTYDAEKIHDLGFPDVMISGINLFRDVSGRSEIRSCMLP